MGTYEPPVFKHPQFTADGWEITEGLRAWDYDRVPVTVVIAGTSADPSEYLYQYWDGWFRVVTDSGGRKLMNGERLRLVDPFTHERA
jgi:hypothetical protein